MSRKKNLFFFLGGETLSQPNSLTFPDKLTPTLVGGRGGENLISRWSACKSGETEEEMRDALFGNYSEVIIVRGIRKGDSKHD